MSRRTLAMVGKSGPLFAESIVECRGGDTYSHLSASVSGILEMMTDRAAYVPEIHDRANARMWAQRNNRYSTLQQVTNGDWSDLESRRSLLVHVNDDGTTYLF
jgi:hypothetical protein